MQNTTQPSPTIKLHQPSTSIADTEGMLAQAPLMTGWNDYNGNFLSALPKAFKDQRYHKRGSSSSSVASAGGPPSPLSHTTLYPHIATSDATFSPSYNDFEFSTPQTAKSLPSSTEAQMMYSRPNNYGVDMRRIHSSGTDERATYSLSAPQSVTTMSHNSPSTPHTNYDNDYDESRNVYGETSLLDEMGQYLQAESGYPNSAAYHEAMQDVFPGQQYTFQQQMQRAAPQSHRASMMADRLQAANQDHLRTNSPTSNPRDKSPFRQNSPYVMPAPQQRPQQPPTLQKTRTSISPKELMLDEHDIDESGPPFPDQSQPTYTRRNPTGFSYNFTAPTFQTEPTVQIPQQYPFVSQQSQQSNQPNITAATPDFPAHLVSMESTVEESGSMPSSQQSLHEPKLQRSPQRPVDTSSDSGTYSCTYHGCAQRFESPAKLQKHKREGHRQVSPGGASPNLALRNSQAGPHRCDRINPSTGKPCNSIFSRPYDLTRHEDTIHNGRKQKVRCHLCTEEKTFSRNDALTRHMRVVHPDVDWVGKQKRKSQK